MSSTSTIDDRMVKAVRKIVPSLTNAKHKGQDGRIGIFGGSLEYTGAPYYAAMSALRVGADLAHIFCTQEAALPIKSLNPEPIVHPILDHQYAIKQIKPWLERLQVIVIGCGLGRDEKTLKTVAELIGICRYIKKPLVIDADGLFLIAQKPGLVKDYPGVILTPNAMEFSRLSKAFLEKTVEPTPVIKAADVKQLAESIGNNVVILLKGAKDTIVDGHKDTEPITCSLAGSGRRCGGQGDLLAGSLAVFWWWALSAGLSETALSPQIVACYAASRLTRECNAAGFKVKQRSMLTSDMIEQIEPVFAKLFETYFAKTPSFCRRSRTKSSDKNNVH
ncbi:ATP-dependent (S)-NAD(P)H-hydrate dehydratase [Belonocnema kinseyi]|uniref:ATP-dependent (S)-NAD(P)H-hydrate dehydratase n=1 Tax=Belonocnema kinseyi TaxID=2817044 RepID=UPI00143D191B|nr:ATP-dependent (S)-NAD(P)H-hydrate dehydratase [Belonocnema kinseyi]